MAELASRLRLVLGCRRRVEHRVQDGRLRHQTGRSGRHANQMASRARASRHSESLIVILMVAKGPEDVILMVERGPEDLLCLLLSQGNDRVNARRTDRWNGAGQHGNA